MRHIHGDGVEDKAGKMHETTGKHGEHELLRRSTNPLHCTRTYSSSQVLLRPVSDTCRDWSGRLHVMNVLGLQPILLTANDFPSNYSIRVPFPAYGRPSPPSPSILLSRVATMYEGVGRKALLQTRPGYSRSHVPSRGTGEHIRSTCEDQRGPRFHLPRASSRTVDSFPWREPR